jgi:hypothetical protein
VIKKGGNERKMIRVVVIQQEGSGGCSELVCVWQIKLFFRVDNLARNIAAS